MGRILLALACAAAGALAPLAGLAQSAYPSKPIRFVAPFPPGGATDTLCRLLAQKLAESLGQPVPVENRPGASGNIGMELAARAAPDGYTIVITSNAITVRPHLYKKLPYDALGDFMPVSLVATAGQVLVVHPSVNVASVAELIALAKARPGALAYGSGGKGIQSHISAEMFKTRTGTDLLHVPYKGTVQAVGDLAVGQVQVVFSDMVPAIPHIRGGRVRALAVTTAKRQAVLPDVPTMIEAGVPDFVADQWWALLVPRATPPEIVERLNAEVARVMRLPDVVERYQSLGMNPAHSTPQHVIELIRTETPEKAKLLKAAGVEPE